MELVAVLCGCRQPFFRDFPPGDFGGTGDIGCADYISMIEMTTRSAQKQSASRAIAFLYMPTLRARSARIARINRDHRDTRQFRLVFDEAAQFGERPFRHLVSLSLPEPSPFADARKVFKSDPAFGVCGFLNDLFRDAMIFVRFASRARTPLSGLRDRCILETKLTEDGLPLCNQRPRLRRRQDAFADQ